jgi:hypothetical protein
LNFTTEPQRSIISYLSRKEEGASPRLGAKRTHANSRARSLRLVRDAAKPVKLVKQAV